MYKKIEHQNNLTFTLREVALFFGLGVLLFSSAILAQTPDQATDCGTITDDKLRLQCYDKQNSKQLALQSFNGLATATTGAAAGAASNLNATPALVLIPSINTVAPVPGGPAAVAVQSAAVLRESNAAIDRLSEKQSGVGRTLNQVWDLDPKAARAPFEILSYKPIYLQIGNNTNSVNRFPSSGSSQNSAVVEQSQSHTEAQFQLSFRSKIWGNIIKDNGALWFGYTQSSRWQIYNPPASRPFRETNYEPEASLVFRTPYSIAGLEGRMTSFSVVHQSNGRSLPLSRSWNRAVMQLGLERGDWMVLVRPWWRLRENAGSDDNPGIENYIGRGELIIAKRYSGQVFSMQARHSLRGGTQSRGSLKLDWAVPISGYLKAHLQLFSGYGESLIDYNHNQTMVGLGVSLVEWR